MLLRIFIGLLALTLAGTASAARAQEDEERPGSARGSYAWGGGGAAEPEDPLRIMAFAGAGVGIRLLANLDPPFRHELLAPAYVEAGAAVFLPGAELRHGAGLSITTNVTQDTTTGAAPPGTQWVLTPSYHLLLPLRRLLPDMRDDVVQIQGRLGIPILIGDSLASDGVDFSVGGELAAAVHLKFLAGLGAYVEAQISLFGGSENTVHPIVAFDAGFLVDYEVLP